jgi:hypothetical protein
VTLVAVSRAGERFSQRLKSFRFRAGDLIVLRVRRSNLADILRRLGCLPLAGRHMPLGVRSASYWSLIVVLSAMGLMAAGHIPVAVAFFAAAVILMLTRAIPPAKPTRPSTGRCWWLWARSFPSAIPCAQTAQPN